MYAIFGLNSGAYHVASTLFHFATAVLVFFISVKWLKNKFFAFCVGVLFLVLAEHAESVFWIAASGHIIAAALVLLSLLSYMYWKEYKNWLLLIISLLACAFGYLFHEFGIVTPFLIIGYDILVERFALLKKWKMYWYYIFYLATIPAYLFLRGIAQSHWFNGDYSYRVSNLPFNIFGNILGYIVLTFVGSPSLQYYEQARDYGKGHVMLVGGVILVVVALLAVLYWFVIRRMSWKQWQTPAFCVMFFVVTLLTFLGLGNITTRYDYLPSFGMLLLFVYLLQVAFGKLWKVQKAIAVVFVVVILGAFSYYQYLQLVRINQDWQRAGTITGNVMKNFNDVFEVGKTTPVNPVFYFVNVPIRTGEAWIFPVGLSDAMWFTFQNENLNVKTAPSLDIALHDAEGSSSARVFEFDKSGNVEEVDQTSE
jgi:hypothetical protein